MEKASRRKEMTNRLKTMGLNEHQQKSAVIADFLMNENEFRKAEVIGLTVSAFPEVDTRQLIERCWQAGKRTAVPKCDPLTRAMTFRIIEDFSQLETVYMKLLEPIEDKTEEVNPEGIDLMIVPGVVYAPDGYRIGFGGGYYDRYLTRYAGPTVSLAFEEQLADSVPVEKHDIPVQRICTELGCRSAGGVAQ